jgi:hypothetical protein
MPTAEVRLVVHLTTGSAVSEVIPAAAHQATRPGSLLSISQCRHSLDVLLCPQCHEISRAWMEKSFSKQWLAGP